MNITVYAAAIFAAASLAHLAFFSDIETCETKHSHATCFQALNR